MLATTVRLVIPGLLLLLAAAPAAADEKELMILKAIYVPVEGSDVEYGQGAIERNELSHAPLSDTEWLIRVRAESDAADLSSRLNRSVDPAHGRFRVETPSQGELERVSSGGIVFQQ